MIRVLIAIVFVVVAVLSMMTYTVRFTDTAVVSTFGRADEGSVQREPGLKFKIPIAQSVTTYDRRARFVETPEETQQTADNRQVVATAFLVWRVEDPLRFYQKFSNAGRRADQHYAEAEELLRSRLRSAMSEMAGFRIDDILAGDLQRSRLADLEEAILNRLRGAGEGDESGTGALGIAVESVGIASIELPEETTTAVFDRMTQVRTRLAEEARTEGVAQAQMIRSSADTDAERILAFARARADQIRTAGDREAATFLAQMNQEPELAVFLKNLDLLRQGLGSRTTLVLSTDMPGMELLRPDALQRRATGVSILSTPLPGEADAADAEPMRIP